MQHITSTYSSRHLLAVLTLCLLQAAGGFALPTSTPTSTTPSPQWSHLLEAMRLFVSRWLNETTAIIAMGAIVGLGAASFAVFGFDWKDYEQGPSEELIIDGGERGCHRSTKYTGI